MSTVEEIERAIKALAPAEFERLREWFDNLTGGPGVYDATPEELAAIDEGLREADAGEFATDEEVEAIFAKYRGG